MATCEKYRLTCPPSSEKPRKKKRTLDLIFFVSLLRMPAHTRKPAGQLQEHAETHRLETALREAQAAMPDSFFEESPSAAATRASGVRSRPRRSALLFCCRRFNGQALGVLPGHLILRLSALIWWVYGSSLCEEGFAFPGGLRAAVGLGVPALSWQPGTGEDRRD